MYFMKESLHIEIHADLYFCIFRDDTKEDVFVHQVRFCFNFLFLILTGADPEIEQERRGGGVQHLVCIFMELDSEIICFEFFLLLTMILMWRSDCKCGFWSCWVCCLYWFFFWGGWFGFLCVCVKNETYFGIRHTFNLQKIFSSEKIKSMKNMDIKILCGQDIEVAIGSCPFL